MSDETSKELRDQAKLLEDLIAGGQVTEADAIPLPDERQQPASEQKTGEPQPMFEHDKASQSQQVAESNSQKEWQEKMLAAVEKNGVQSPVASMTADEKQTLILATLQEMLAFWKAKMPD